MRRIRLLIASFLFMGTIYGQGAYEALLFSQNNYIGTARSAAMGNAFTSLGGDTYALSLNPASSALYNHSEFTITPSFNIDHNNSTYLNHKERENWNRFTLPNVGLVAPLKLNLRSSSGLTNLSFGLAINTLRDFNERSYTAGVNNNSSWLASIADDMTYRGLDNTHLDEVAGWNPFYSYPDASWREILAWNSNLLDPLGSSNSEYIAATENIFIDPITAEEFIALAGPLEQRFFREQKGSISEFLLNMGASFNDKIHFGINVGFQTLYYSDYQKYYEEAINPENFTTLFHNFTHLYKQNSSGMGFSLKAGVIATPFEGFRVGAAISSPTWYVIRDMWEESIDARYSDNYRSKIDSPVGEYDFRLNTPMRWSLGLSYVFDQVGLVSIDYEGVNYGSAKMISADRMEFKHENQYISQNFNLSHILRGGVEVRATQSLSLRAGYTLYSAPDEYSTNVNYVSAGFGYRAVSGFFLDFALQGRVSEPENFSLYNSYEGNPAPIGSMDRSAIRALLTIGLKF